MNRKRKHPLEAQCDKDWACGLFIMTACILCAFLLGLPSMSRARFSVPNEHEREPTKKVKPTPDWAEEAKHNKN